MAPTTLKKKITDVVSFLRWLQRASPKGVRLSGRMLAAAIDHLLQHQRDLSREVTGHQQDVRRQKSGL